MWRSACTVFSISAPPCVAEQPELVAFAEEREHPVVEAVVACALELGERGGACSRRDAAAMHADVDLDQHVERGSRRPNRRPCCR